jgi:alkylhydroperoxidase family enzyme
LSEQRIPPRPFADWGRDFFEALSVMRPPGVPARTPEEVERLRRDRPVPGMVGIFSWHPALAGAFFAFNSHLFSSTLSDRVRELVTVRVCWLRGGEYEWEQHVRMARRAGLSDAEIDAISVGPDAPAWGAADAALLRAVDEMVADRYIGDDSWKQLSEHLDRQQLMDLVFTVGAYDLLAMAFNTFGLPLDPGMSGFPAAAKD